MSEHGKIDYIKSKGWHQWYSNTHWVHKDIFKMFEKTGIRYWKSDYTNYQMTLDEAYDLTMTNEEKSEKPINPMTNQIVVITDSTGTKAWTVNPLGLEEPKPMKRCGALTDSCGYGEEYCDCKLRNKWQQAESERKCYEVIDWRLYHEICESNEGFCGCFDFGMVCENKKNTRYLAEIVDENTVRILKEVV